MGDHQLGSGLSRVPPIQNYRTQHSKLTALVIKKLVYSQMSLLRLLFILEDN